MSSLEWIPIEIRSYYDTPRLVRMKMGANVYILDCAFNDALDDYESAYEVYRITGDAAVQAECAHDWLAYAIPKYRVGTLDVAAVRLDPTRRQFFHHDTAAKLEAM